MLNSIFIRGNKVNIYKKLRNHLFAFGIKATIKKVVLVRYQNKFIKFYYDKNSLSKAIKLGKKIVRVDPGNSYNYQQLARAYRKSKDDISAVKTLKQGIKQSCQMDIEEIIKKIESIISNERVVVTSKLLFYGGHQNYGFLEHKYKDKTLVTKIMNNKDSRGEVLIKKLQGNHSFVNEITPNIINIISIKDLSFITMEKIYCENQVEMDRSFLEKVVKVSNTITSIKNSDCPEFEGWPTYDFVAEPSNKHELFKNFYTVNDNNSRIYSACSMYLIKYNYPSKIIKIINYLNNIIEENKYYERIDSEKYFSLQHGDFFKDNMIRNYQSEDLKVIDWGGIRVGPKWVDIGVFFGVTKLDFEEIKQIFLSNRICNYDSIEKMFFMYTLIVTWAVTCSVEEVDKFYKTKFSPALKYVDKLKNDLENEKVNYHKSDSNIAIQAEKGF